MNIATPMGLIDYHQSVLGSVRSQLKQVRIREISRPPCMCATHHHTCAYTTHMQTESICACMQTEITKAKTKCGDITDFEKRLY